MLILRKNVQATIQALVEAGIDLIEVSGGTYEAPAMSGAFQKPGKASTAAREAYFLEFAEEVRKRIQVPLMVTGGFRTADGMNAALRSGSLDVVGEGISAVTGVTFYDMLRGFFTGQDPKQYLFFAHTPDGIDAGKAFLARLNERSENRDKKISVAAFLAQLEAIRAWGRKEPENLSLVQNPVFVVNGDSDRMVPSKNSEDLVRRLPNSKLLIYPDSGHGAVFQFYADFVPKALEFPAQ
ncbi:alpha/beta fold hydrolase [Paraburkholderia sp. CNPSo 3274]|uniref:alpha/beta fold hydrolase n=1 Tax=Paraburkholderia sp. CNPSo 3274 TaxID=2940932 RepID=UPI0035CD09C4